MRYPEYEMDPKTEILLMELGYKKLERRNEIEEVSQKDLSEVFSFMEEMK